MTTEEEQKAPAAAEQKAPATDEQKAPATEEQKAPATEEQKAPAKEAEKAAPPAPVDQGPQPTFMERLGLDKESEIPTWKQVLLFKPTHLAIVSIVVAFWLGRFGFSPLWSIFIVIPVLLVTEKLWMKRHVNKVTAEFRKKLIDSPPAETVDWINNFLRAFWTKNSYFISKTVVDAVAPQLAANTPGFLTEIGFAKFDLGNNCPVLTSFQAHPTKFEDQMELDVTFSYNGDMSIVVFAKAAITPKIPVQVNNVRLLNFKTRIHVKFIPDAPFVSVVGVQLLERPNPKPKVDVKCLATTDLPGIKTWINSIVDNVLVNMMLAPKMLQIPLVENPVLFDAEKADDINAALSKASAGADAVAQAAEAEAAAPAAAPAESS